MTFPCVRDPKIEHTAVVDVSHYPERWRIIKSDVLDTPLIREFDPCAALLTKGYYEDEQEEFFSFYEIFYEWLCKSKSRLPEKGLVPLLERMFNDTIHESWDLRNQTVKESHHYRLAKRVIGKHKRSEYRFRLLISRNALSVDNAFVKACLKENPKLTCRLAYQQLLDHCPNAEDMPSPRSKEDIYLETLMHPAGHAKLIRFFETRNHEKIFNDYIGTSSWYQREKVYQYSKLALLAFDSVGEHRRRRKLQRFSPAHTKRAMQIINTLYHLISSRRYPDPKSIRKELASILMVAQAAIPPLPH